MPRGLVAAVPLYLMYVQDKCVPFLWRQNGMVCAWTSFMMLNCCTNRFSEVGHLEFGDFPSEVTSCRMNRLAVPGVSSLCSAQEQALLWVAV